MIVKLLLGDLVVVKHAHHRLEQRIGDSQLILEQPIPGLEFHQGIVVLLLQFGYLRVVREVVAALFVQKRRFLRDCERTL